MRYLTSKYPEGYEGWAKERGEELASGYNDDYDTRPLVSSYASLSSREILQPRAISVHKRILEWLETSVSE